MQTQAPLDLETLTLRDIHRILVRELEALDDSFEYFSVSTELLPRQGRADQPIGRYRWIACYAVTGGSEGHYIHVDRIYQKGEFDRAFTQEALFLAKTFGGYDRACEIAAYIGKRLDV